MGSGTAVLDGPALAYHAYYVALARRSSARNALEAMPGYGEVNQVAVELLDALQKHGIRIAAIFFDGGLPKWKQEVRLQRLNTYLRQLENYRAQHPSSFASLHVGCQISVATPPNHFSVLPIPAKLKTLPPLPFLVPSVVEALHVSSYSDLTSVIPGEADCFCASYAKSHGAMVITSDSDLLAYDLSPNGSVVLFKDMEFHSSEVGSRLRIARFETASVARRFALPSFQSLAFAKNEDPHRNFNSCLEYARRLSCDLSQAYSSFAMRYETLSGDALETETRLRFALRRLDPRISEWVLEVLDPGPVFAPLLDAQDGVEDKVSSMYLPVLIEDASRASPWNVGAAIRTLAYSLLQPSAEAKFYTKEIMRIGNRIAEKTCMHLYLQSSREMLEELGHLLTRLGAVILDQNMFWPLVAVYLICQQLIAEGKKQPSRNMLKSVLLRRRAQNDWEYIHLCARMQAAAYSLRILHKCLQVLTAVNLKFLPEDFIRQHARHLESMPSIASCFDEQLEVEEVALNTMIDYLYEALGIQDDVCQPMESTTSSKKRRRKKKRGETQADRWTGRNQPLYSNKFGVLLTDN
jgi:hypothetical protein